MRYAIRTIVLLVGFPGLACADEADDVIISYLLQRDRFEWRQVSDKNREIVMARLREFYDGKKDHVENAAGEIVTPNTAHRMLIGLGDETLISESIRSYRGSDLGYQAIEDIVETGQIAGLAELTVDLESDRYLGSGPEAAYKRHDSAQYIVKLVRYCQEFTAELRGSAATLEPMAWRDPHRFDTAVTEWWHDNKASIVDERYSSVTPFAALDAAEKPAGPSVSTNKIRGETDRGLTESQKGEQIDEAGDRSRAPENAAKGSGDKETWKVAFWVGLAVIGCSALLVWKRRRSS